MERLDLTAASQLPRRELAYQVGEIVTELLQEEQIRLNGPEHQAVVELMLDDMLGLGPLEPLLADESITDIMVNGPNQVYVEQGGKLNLTSVKFRDDAHVLNVSRRIVSQVGRRVDETTPMVDARLKDGSRVNIIIPPLAIDGPSISIRKFAKKKITLDVMMRQGNISDAMCTLLKIAARSRLNILISGGTGSGKTTLLNAMSQMIDHGERVVTIEDAAELAAATAARGQIGDPARQPGGPGRHHHARSWSRTPCVCAPTASSSARCAAARRSTCCRP